MEGAKSLPHKSGIYKITNLINNKVYIGQAEDIHKRYNQHHKYEYKYRKYKLYQAFIKYGLDNFKIEVVELCKPEEMNEKEIYWIQYYDSFKNGYNMTLGGQNLTPNLHSSETEKKRRATREKNDSLKGENHPRAKLTNDEVIQIRQRYKDGESLSNIYEDYKELYKNKSTFSNIIKGRTYKNVGNQLNKDEIRHGGSVITKETVLEIRRLFLEEDYSIKKLKEKYPQFKGSIEDIVHYRTFKNVEDNFKNKKFRSHYRLQPDEVRNIRKLHANGTTIAELSEQYHMSLEVIRNCVNRKTYQNIE